METKEDFKDELKHYRDIRKKEVLNDKTQEKLKALENCENLILFGVGVSLEVEEKEILINLLVSHIEYMKHHFINEKAFKDSEKKYRKLIKKISDA